MRLSQSLILAGALFAAAPAIAQDNADVPANTVATNEVDANMAAMPPAAPTDVTATPTTETAPPATAAADTGTTTEKRGFPWGVLGLLGLVGLLGARKARS